MNNYKTFPLNTILTVTTGRLLTTPKGDKDNGISDLYEILGHMTGDIPFTHSLGRFADDCKPYLLLAFPDLSNADVDELDKMEGEYGWISNWLSRCVNEWGMQSEYSVGQILGGHEKKNPISELDEMIHEQPHIRECKGLSSSLLDALSEVNNLSELSDTEEQNAKAMYYLCEEYMQSIEFINDWNEYL